MAKFQKGQTVWGGVLKRDGFVVGQSIVDACGESKVTLATMDEWFKWRLRASVNDVHASEIETLQALAEEAERERDEAERDLARAKDNLRAVADAIARLAGAKP